MPYFVVDDEAHDHPKVVKAGNAAFGAWVRMGSWSRRRHTDGFIPKDVAPMFASKREVNKLLACGLKQGEHGLLEEVEGGFQIHDWDDVYRRIDDRGKGSHQLRDSKAAKCAAAGKKGAAKRWNKGSDPKPDPIADPKPDPIDPNGVTPSDPNGVSDGNAGASDPHPRSSSEVEGTEIAVADTAEVPGVSSTSSDGVNGVNDRVNDGVTPMGWDGVDPSVAAMIGELRRHVHITKVIGDLEHLAIQLLGRAPAFPDENTRTDALVAAVSAAASELPESTTDEAARRKLRRFVENARPKRKSAAPDEPNTKRPELQKIDLKERKAERARLRAAAEASRRAGGGS